MDYSLDGSNACYPSVKSYDVRATTSCDPEKWGVPPREHDCERDVCIAKNTEAVCNPGGMLLLGGNVPGVSSKSRVIYCAENGVESDVAENQQCQCS